jgi:hypothetical protein
MASKSIEAGKAFVRVDADLNPLQKKLGQIDASFKAVGARIAKIGAGFAAVGAATTAIGSSALASITALSQRFAGLGDELSKARDRTGIAASSLSELGYAAEQSGTDLATVEKAVAKMQRGITEANAGSKSMAEAFQAIGLSTKKLAALNPEQQFLAVGEAISRIQDPTRRAAAAMDVFGKSGTQLLPLLISDIEALRKEARDLGVVISDDDAKNATNLGDAFDRVKKSLGGIATQLGAAIAVPFTKIANALASIVGKVSAWVAVNRDVVRTVAAVAGAMVVAGGLVTALGVTLIGLGATIASISTIASAAFAAVGTAIAVVTSPITLAVAGITAIGYMALQATGGITVLAGMFSKLGETATTAWGGIVAAIGSGDLQTAGQIAFTALEVGWLTITTKMQEVWKRVSDFFVNVWLNAVESIIQIGANIYFGVSTYFDKLTVALQDGFDVAGVYIIGIIDSIQTAISRAIIKAMELARLLSKDDAAGAIGILNEDAADRAAGRDRGLGQRMGGRAAGLGQRDAERRRDAEQFGDIVADDINRKRPGVDSSGLSAAQKRLEELKAKLASQSSDSQEKAAKAQTESAMMQRLNLAKLGLDNAIQGSGSVGTFVGGIAGRIAGGGVTDDAAQTTANNTTLMVDQLRLLTNGGLA